MMGSADTWTVVGTAGTTPRSAAKRALVISFNSCTVNPWGNLEFEPFSAAESTERLADKEWLGGAGRP